MYKCAVNVFHIHHLRYAVRGVHQHVSNYVDDAVLISTRSTVRAESEIITLSSCSIPPSTEVRAESRTSLTLPAVIANIDAARHPTPDAPDRADILVAHRHHPTLQALTQFITTYTATGVRHTKLKNS